MFAAVCALLGRVRVTLVLAGAVTVVAEVLLYLGPQVQSEVVQRASTNLRNLGQGRVDALIGSVFVNDSGPIYVWLPGLVAMLALGELLWQSRRLLVAFTVGHLGATLIVAGGLAAALAAGLLSTSIADAADVGMSYGVVAVLGTFTAAIPNRWRPAWVAWWLSVAVGAIALSGGDFTTVGHAVALILGMAMGSRFGEPQRWTVARCGLLAVAAGFGYLLVSYNERSFSIATGFDALVALAVWGGSVLVQRSFFAAPR